MIQSTNSRGGDVPQLADAPETHAALQAKPSLANVQCVPTTCNRKALCNKWTSATGRKSASIMAFVFSAATGPGRVVFTSGGVKGTGIPGVSSPAGSSSSVRVKRIVESSQVISEYHRGALYLDQGIGFLERKFGCGVGQSGSCVKHLVNTVRESKDATFYVCAIRSRKQVHLVQTMSLPPRWVLHDCCKLPPRFVSGQVFRFGVGSRRVCDPPHGCGFKCW